MVLMEMMKEFTRGEALIVHPHNAVHWFNPFDAGIIGQVFNDSEELLKDLM